MDWHTIELLMVRNNAWRIKIVKKYIREKPVTCYSATGRVGRPWRRKEQAVNWARSEIQMQPGIGVANTFVSHLPPGIPKFSSLEGQYPW